MIYNDLPSEEWLKFFDELGRCSVLNVCLAGGEPFIREDLPQIIKGIVENRMRFTILSNGALIDEWTAAFLAKTGRCDGVQISIDGASPIIHDSCRGKGSFEGAVNGISLLQRHGLPVDVRVTIHRENVLDLENISSFLLEHLNIKRFGTNYACLFGSCRENSHEILLTANERKMAMEKLLTLTAKYPGRIYAQGGPLADARSWQNMEASRCRGDPQSSRGGRLAGCGGAFSKISVRSDGTITPCTLLSDVELGRINRDSLIDIWHNSAALQDLRERSQIPLASFEFCADCSYIPYCSGGCPGLALSMVGRTDHPCPDCLRKYQNEGGMLPRIMG
jgi:Fe-coproporphyrin III synthase